MKQNKTKKEKGGMGEMRELGSGGFILGKQETLFFQTFLGMTLLFLGYRVVSKGWWVKDDRKTCVCGGLKRQRQLESSE